MDRTCIGTLGAFSGTPIACTAYPLLPLSLFLVRGGQRWHLKALPGGRVWQCCGAYLPFLQWVQQRGVLLPRRLHQGHSAGLRGALLLLPPWQWRARARAHGVILHAHGKHCAEVACPPAPPPPPARLRRERHSGGRELGGQLSRGAERDSPRGLYGPHAGREKLYHIHARGWRGEQSGHNLHPHHPGRGGLRRPPGHPRKHYVEQSHLLPRGGARLPGAGVRGVHGGGPL